MASSDGNTLFPPRASDQRIIDFIAHHGTLTGKGVDQDFKQALGNDLGLSAARIQHLNPNDMWALWLATAGLTGKDHEPFTFPIAGAVVSNYLLESGDNYLQEDGISPYLTE